LARKGSKGLPNKHLLPFNGKPLIEWTIWNAKDYAKGKDADIVVATDSMETFNLAGDLGVCAIPRNPKYATDEAGKVDAIRDVWKQREGELWIKGNELILSNPIYDCVIDLDVTNPCRTVEDIANAFKIFCDKKPKTLFSVVKSKKNPYFNQIQYFKDYGMYFPCINGIARNQLVRRQDAPEVFDLNSNIYIYGATWLKKETDKSVITVNSEIYEMPDWSFCDIDNATDFEVAELLHKKYVLKKEGNVQSKGKNCSCSGWSRAPWNSNYGCTPQARGIYFSN
jgi:CMP-N-acetylneuraminic acid synthetase